MKVTNSCADDALVKGAGKGVFLGLLEVGGEGVLKNYVVIVAEYV